MKKGRIRSGAVGVSPSDRIDGNKWELDQDTQASGLDFIDSGIQLSKMPMPLSMLAARKDLNQSGSYQPRLSATLSERRPPGQAVFLE